MHRLLVIIISLFSVLFSQTQQPEVTVNCDITQSTVGVPVEYTVTVRHTSDLFLTLPDDREYLDINGKKVPRYIVAEKHISKKESAGAIQWNAVISVIFLKPGSWALPVVSIRDIDSQETVYVNKQIEIVSVNIDNKQEDIEGPIALQGNYTRLFLLLSGGIALLITIIWLIRFLRKRVKRTVVAEEDPYEIFKRDAIALYAEDLIDRNNIEEHMQRLSLVFRRFVSQSYRCNALESTSDEVITMLTSSGVSTEIIGRTQKIIYLWDLAKFAELRPTQETARMNFKDTLKLADDLVRRESEHE